MAAQLLSESKEAPYRLWVRIIYVDQPTFGGFDMTVTTEVHYKLTKKDNNQEILNEVVRATYKAKFSDHLMGIERLRLANEGASRENIKKIIEILYVLDIEATEVILENLAG